MGMDTWGAGPMPCLLAHEGPGAVPEGLAEAAPSEADEDVIVVQIRGPFQPHVGPKRRQGVGAQGDGADVVRLGARTVTRRPAQWISPSRRASASPMRIPPSLSNQTIARSR